MSLKDKKLDKEFDTRGSSDGIGTYCVPENFYHAYLTTKPTLQALTQEEK